MTGTGEASGRLGRWAGPAAVAALFVAMLRWTWRAWPDPLVDFGQQLYNGWQLSQGKALYRDIDWVFGPLSQHVVAGWFRLAGVSLASMVSLNLLVLVAVVVMVYRLAGAIAGRVAAAAAGLVFVAVFALGQYSVVSNYNYLTPYAIDATHGIAISLAALLLVQRFARAGGAPSVAGVGICLGLLFLNKPEYFVAVTAGAAAGLAGALSVRRAPARAWVRTAAVLAVAALLPVGVMGAFLARRQGLVDALAALATPWGLLGRADILGGEFYRGLSGLRDAGGYLRHMAGVLGCHAAALAPALLVARRCKPGAGAVAAGIGAGAAAGALLWVAVPPIAWLAAVAPLPVEAAAVALWAAWRLRRAGAGDPAGAAPARLAVAVFAVALLAKTLLNTQTGHYGFVLAMPAAMLAVCALMGWVPARLDAAGGSGLAFRCAAGVLLAVFVLAHWRIERELLAAKVHHVGEGADRFRSDGRGRNIDAAVAALRSLTGPADRVFVMPEGTIINYLARRENPGPLFGFLPNGFVEESDVLGVLAGNRPAAVVLTNRSVAEFGVAPLGAGYGVQVLALLDRDYRVAAQFGPSPLLPGSDGIAILLRRDRLP